MEAVSQCMKSIRATALQEKANGKTANNAPRCRKRKNPAIFLLNVGLGFTLLSVGIVLFLNKLQECLIFSNL